MRQRGTIKYTVSQARYNWTALIKGILQKGRLSIMINIKRLLFLSLVCMPSWFSYGQIKDIGIPSVINHTRVLTGAGTQSWDITQSRKGFMYFGNNDGVLEFDGTGWNIYPVPNASVVRSVLAVGDTIYAGAFEEIGFLAPDDSGLLAWHSLNHLVPEKYKQFAEIWHIFATQDRIVFQSFHYLLVYEDDTIKVIEPPSDLSLMYDAHDRLYVTDKENGLLIFKDDSLQLISDHPVFFRNEVRFVLPLEQQKMLIGTSNEGVFVWNGKNLRTWATSANKQLVKDNLYSGIRLSNGDFAFGTIRNGLYISNKNGELLQHINRHKGLQNNTILSIFQDRRQNLWLGLDNGIDYIETSSPITYMNYNYNIESSYASIIHDDILYVGTNQGLYAAKTDQLRNSRDIDEIFTLIDGTEGQVWSLKIVDNILLCGHNFGSFQIDGFDARRISDRRGFWSFVKHPHFDDLIIAGTYSGLVRLEKRGENWFFLDEIEGFWESSRDLYLDHKNYLWISHGYKGLFKLEATDDFSMVQEVHFFRDEAGLPFELPFNILDINGQMFVSTHSGIFKFDHDHDTFIPDDKLNALFENKGFIDKVHQDARGNLWYFTHHFMGVMRLLEDGTFRDITSPFSRVNDFLLPAFQNIFIADFYNVFIGSQKGLMHYSPDIINDYQTTEQVGFKEISFYGKEQTRSFFLYCPQMYNNHQHPPHLKYKWNSVTFRFTTPVYENPAAIRFSYKLEGFDVSWSEWNASNFKEYTNLREGDYVFRVKALDAFRTESEIASFYFSVAPPFLRSKTAYFIYAFLLVLIISGNVYFVRKRLLKIRQREKIRHEKRLARREQIFNEQTALSEKEIVHLRNESLNIEMLHKNKELANATMHLIQKNETLNNLKNDLNKLLKNIPSDNPEKHSVNVLLKKVNRDIRNEKHWELFDSYFDEVHQDFLKRLKQRYNNLSAKEMRLCAYLRMNLTTKEIAPLMNISVRGVEISRYRLRKKLAIDQHTNLSDFIISY